MKSSLLFSLSILACFNFVVANNPGQKIFISSGFNQPESCGTKPELADVKVKVSMGKSDFLGDANTEMCGKCVFMKGKDGELIGTIVSKCGDRCTAGVLEIGEEHAKILQNDANANGFDIKWAIIDCAAAEADGKPKAGITVGSF